MLKTLRQKMNLIKPDYWNALPTKIIWRQQDNTFLDFLENEKSTFYNIKVIKYSKRKTAPAWF